VLDPDRHVLPANGTKEAVFLLAFALMDKESGRDTGRNAVVIPSPAYPVYEYGARLAGAEVFHAPLSSSNRWHFDPASVPGEVWDRTALLWLNDPHNPTGALLERAEIERIVRLARERGFWVGGDHAYDELSFGDRRPASVLEFGLDNAIAFHTLSKRSAMTGFRSGFMAGDERLISALRRMRPSVGVATPEFIQDAAITAWSDDAHVGALRERFRAKRETMLAYFAKRAWQIEASEATFYLWMKAPGGDDVAFAERLIRAGVVATPGSFLGRGGEGYLRWALVPTQAQVEEAVRRLDAVADPVTR
jgi:acetylornithine aminotransferase